MKKATFFATWLLSCVLTCAQLLPSIGLNALPQDTDSICTIPLVQGSFDQNGYTVGDYVPDFSLYEITGQVSSLSQLLGEGKPVLLVGGSYTCPVFRNKLAELNQLVTSDGQDINIRVIYSVEAHPDVDISPYSGSVWTTSANTQAGILYRQSKTYGERKSVVTDMLNDLQINAPVLLDGPCNEWWSHFGPAPNNAYLIDTTGQVYEKNGWFNRPPANMGVAIDSLLAGAPAGSGGSGGGLGGGFDFQLIDRPVVRGYPGEIMEIHAELTNYSSKGVNVQIRRTQNNLAPDWSTALCVDVCLPPSEDETFVYMRPNTTQSFTFYFYSSNTPDSSTARVGFRNVDSTANQFVVNLKGVTSGTTAIENEYLSTDKLEIWPQPSHGFLFIKSPFLAREIVSLTLFDLYGKQHYGWSRDMLSALWAPEFHIKVNLPKIPAGIYLIKLQSEKGLLSKKVVLN